MYSRLNRTIKAQLKEDFMSDNQKPETDDIEWYPLITLSSFSEKPCSYWVEISFKIYPLAVKEVCGARVAVGESHVISFGGLVTYGNPIEFFTNDPKAYVKRLEYWERPE